MTREESKEILRLLIGYYPKRYPDDMSEEKAKFIVEDLTDSFKDYEFLKVKEAYKEWHLHFTQAPMVADILNILRYSSRKAENGPTRWTEYFEDDEGYGYAKNSRDGQFDCIWKPSWSRERKVMIRGEMRTFPAVSKTEVLKKYGIGE